jgi:hypothetical protein
LPPGKSRPAEHHGFQTKRHPSVTVDTHTKNEMKNSTKPGTASFDYVANGKQYDNIKN